MRALSISCPVFSEELNAPSTGWVVSDPIGTPDIEAYCDAYGDIGGTQYCCEEAVIRRVGLTVPDVVSAAVDGGIADAIGKVVTPASKEAVADVVERVRKVNELARTAKYVGGAAVAVGVVVAGVWFYKKRGR